MILFWQKSIKLIKLVFKMPNSRKRHNYIKIISCSIIFLSLIESSRLIIAVTPDLINCSIPSLKGKKASDAATEFSIFSGVKF